MYGKVLVQQLLELLKTDIKALFTRMKSVRRRDVFPPIDIVTIQSKRSSRRMLYLRTCNLQSLLNTCLEVSIKSKLGSK